MSILSGLLPKWLPHMRAAHKDHRPPCARTRPNRLVLPSSRHPRSLGPNLSLPPVLMFLPPTRLSLLHLRDHLPAHSPLILYPCRLPRIHPLPPRLLPFLLLPLPLLPSLLLHRLVFNLLHLLPCLHLPLSPHPLRLLHASLLLL